VAQELAFVLINPYTIAKSRTGGVIARYMGRTDLDFVAARMFGPCRQLVDRYARSVRSAHPADREMCDLIADYVLKSYAPDPVTGEPKRVLMLLFEGEDAVHKTWQVTGSATLPWGSGETIRDTYGDYITDDEGTVKYFEPAVLVAPDKKRAASTLRLWNEYADSDGGVIDTSGDVQRGEGVERTLVLIKPDNFRFHSSRTGNIIDILSRSGLRIIGTKKFCMTVAQAERFYGPVRQSLEAKFATIGGKRATAALEKEFGLTIPPAALTAMYEELAPLFARAEFERIVEFMTGYRPSDCTPSEKLTLGREECLALVYQGKGAIGKLRSILGTTDPNKASEGSVRREYGSNVMVNAAHASDSPENAEREMEIVRIGENTVSTWVDRYYGSIVTRVASAKALDRKSRYELLRKVRKGAKSVWTRNSQ
jgi:nucleoside diphosphate kinase